MKTFTLFCALIVGLGTTVWEVRAADGKPEIQSIQRLESDLVISAIVPDGFRHVVLRSGSTLRVPIGHSLAVGALAGYAGTVTFRIPDPGSLTFLRLEAGESAVLPNAQYSGEPHFTLAEHPRTDEGLAPEAMVDHLLNRITYGPSDTERDRIEKAGIDAYIQSQLDPQPELDATNVRLTRLEGSLFDDFRPFKDEALIRAGEEWAYFKGTRQPPSAWREIDFNAAGWERGPSGIGYGDNDDETVLSDMRQTDENPGYLSVFMRKRFQVADPSAFHELVLDVLYDDGFVAFLNGREIGRANMSARNPLYNSTASATVGDRPESFSETLGDPAEFLVPGWNVLAIQLHNTNLTSSDASLIPELRDRQYLTDETFARIKGINELQQLVHIRGVLAENQLQAILAEFWENHFTTDFDKVAEHLEDLRDSDEERNLSDDQAEWEAAQIEFNEYQFFYDNALGNFGDLLLYSATSPSQLIYLDNVLNKVGEPNENYSREILELFAFGVDNRYSQDDIEQLAKCFTGWQIRKVRYDQRLSYPESARQPPILPSIGFVESVLLDVGRGWTYFKGQSEPSPDGRTPTTQWTELSFDDSTWLSGATSIGYGDGDDATVLRDMRRSGNRQGYSSVYLRRMFTLDAPSEEGLFLAIDYDDGFVAYLNGVEFARSTNMEGRGEPPRFSRTTSGNHEVTAGTEYISLAAVQDLLKASPEPNVLAIQVHNVEPTSSDLSVHPRIVQRVAVPGSIENSDPSGFWAFRFNPEDHDLDSKVLFEGTPHQMVIPEGRDGRDGLLDALEVIDSMIAHPSTAEFITLKLINRFVSDEISLDSYHDRTAPEAMIRLMEEAILAWYSTSPPGNIRTVMATLLDSQRPGNAFWSERAYRGKVKNPVEFINSMIRALDWPMKPEDLPEVSDAMGMHLFTRDDPDGWSEYGFDWVSTGGLLERINFAERLSDYQDDDFLEDWDVAEFLESKGIETAEEIVDYFDRLLVNGKMSEHTREVLLDYAATNRAGRLLPFTPRRGDYEQRAGELIGLILSMPECQYQ